MAERPFHHGNLRAVLLDRAEVVLRESGVDALSLRELARDAGVSHGAPRSHFVDRNALLDAVAERGYGRLVTAVRSAAARHPDDPRSALRAAGSAYLDFAISEASLLDLMFAVKIEAPSEAVGAAATELFLTMNGLVRDVVEATVDVEQLTLLLSATTQGIAAFVASGRISPEQGESLLDGSMVLVEPR